MAEGRGRPEKETLTLDEYCDQIKNPSISVCDKEWLVNLSELDEIARKAEIAKRARAILEYINAKIKAAGLVANVVSIGKTYIEKEKSKESFNAMNPETWDKHGISVCCSQPQHKDNSYDLIVLTVVTKEVVPSKFRGTHEKYAITLRDEVNKGLRISKTMPGAYSMYCVRIYCMYTGRPTEEEKLGYVLYMACKRYIELTQHIITFSFSSDSKKDDKKINKGILVLHSRLIYIQVLLGCQK